MMSEYIKKYFNTTVKMMDPKETAPKPKTKPKVYRTYLKIHEKKGEQSSEASTAREGVHTVRGSEKTIRSQAFEPKKPVEQKRIPEEARVRRKDPIPEAPKKPKEGQSNVASNPVRTDSGEGSESTPRSNPSSSEGLLPNSKVIEHVERPQFEFVDHRKAPTSGRLVPRFESMEFPPSENNFLSQPADHEVEQKNQIEQRKRNESFESDSRLLAQLQGNERADSGSKSRESHKKSLDSNEKSRESGEKSLESYEKSGELNENNQDSQAGIENPLPPRYPSGRTDESPMVGSEPSSTSKDLESLRLDPSAIQRLNFQFSAGLEAEFFNFLGGDVMTGEIQNSSMTSEECRLQNFLSSDYDDLILRENVPDIHDSILDNNRALSIQDWNDRIENGSSHFRSEKNLRKNMPGFASFANLLPLGSDPEHTDPEFVEIPVPPPVQSQNFFKKSPNNPVLEIQIEVPIIPTHSDHDSSKDQRSPRIERHFEEDSEPPKFSSQDSTAPPKAPPAPLNIKQLYTEKYCVSDSLLNSQGPPGDSNFLFSSAGPEPPVSEELGEWRDRAETADFPRLNNLEAPVNNFSSGRNRPDFLSEFQAKKEKSQPSTAQPGTDLLEEINSIYKKEKQFVAPGNQERIPNFEQEEIPRTPVAPAEIPQIHGQKPKKQSPEVKERNKQTFSENEEEEGDRRDDHEHSSSENESHHSKKSEEEAALNECESGEELQTPLPFRVDDRLSFKSPNAISFKEFDSVGPGFYISETGPYHTEERDFKKPKTSYESEKFIFEPEGFEDAPPQAPGGFFEPDNAYRSEERTSQEKPNGSINNESQHRSQEKPNMVAFDSSDHRMLSELSRLSFEERIKRIISAMLNRKATLIQRSFRSWNEERKSVAALFTKFLAIKREALSGPSSSAICQQQFIEHMRYSPWIRPAINKVKRICEEAGLELKGEKANGYEFD